MKYTFYIFLFFLMLSGISRADTTSMYTARTVEYLAESDLLADEIILKRIDTLLAGFQHYNPAFNPLNPHSYLGNLGTAAKPVFNNINMSPGFYAGQYAFDLYLVRPEKIRYYRTKSPYTNLYYINSRKTEQLFELTHSQNITPRLNAAFDFKRIASEGNFQRQKTDHLNVDFSTWYHTANKRYYLLSNVIYNSLKAEEHGGVLNDSLFTVPSALPTEFEPVKLAQAQNQVSTRSVYLKQFFNIGVKSMIKSDSITIKNLVPTQRFSHSILLEENTYRYKDEAVDAADYPHIYLDSSATSDRIQHTFIRNRISYELLPEKANGDSAVTLRFLQIALAAEHQTTKYTQTFDTLINDLWVEPSIRFNFSSSLHSRVFGRFQANAVSDPRYNAGINSWYGSGKRLFQADLLVSRVEPAFLYQHYSSNHYRWENKFDAVQVIRTGIGYAYAPGTSIALQADRISNYIYPDSLAVPRRLPETAQILSAIISQNFHIGLFSIDNSVRLQRSDAPEVFSAPLFYSYHSLYVDFRLFKVLQTRTGLDIRYHTTYDIWSYAPSLRQFYKGSDQAVGNYPVADLFIAARLKRVKLLMKVDHLNQGILKNGYYQVQGYPVAKRSLKLGISWGFYD